MDFTTLINKLNTFIKNNPTVKVRGDKVNEIFKDVIDYGIEDKAIFDLFDGTNLVKAGVPPVANEFIVGRNYLCIADGTFPSSLAVYAGMIVQGYIVDEEVFTTAFKIIYCPNEVVMAANPSVTFDISKAVVQNNTIVRNSVTGNRFICTANTLGAAVWVPFGYVNFSLALSAENLTTGPRFDIPQLVELPAGYMWNIINVVVDYIYGTEDYDSLALSVETLGADTIAYDDAASISGAHNSMTFLMTPYFSTTLGTMKATGKVRVNVGGSPTTGDGTVKIYGLAQVIKLI